MKCLNCQSVQDNSVCDACGYPIQGTKESKASFVEDLVSRSEAFRKFKAAQRLGTNTLLIVALSGLIPLALGFMTSSLTGSYFYALPAYLVAVTFGVLWVVSKRYLYPAVLAGLFVLVVDLAYNFINNFYSIVNPFMFLKVLMIGGLIQVLIRRSYLQEERKKYKHLV